MMTSTTNERGMTLIELTMAGLLIGLLAALTWPSARAAAKRSIVLAAADRTEMDRRQALWESR